MKNNKEKRLRVTVYRSNNKIFGQIVDDEQGKTLSSISSEKKSIDSALKAGEALAKKAKESKITKVVFDRNKYRYQGRVKAFADGLRKGGLEF